MSQDTAKAVVSTLTAFGGMWALYQASKIAAFIHLYFLRSSTLDRYKGSKDRSWALVTGSTDGIGRGFAQELCARGFNVVIHGRNKEKLAVERQKLLDQYPQAEVRVLQIDASKESSDPATFDRAAAELKGLNLKVLINNIGGTGKRLAFAPMHSWSSEDLKFFWDINLHFPTEITRVLLTQLMSNSPALIINIGSAASEMSMPYLGLYSGSKAYNMTWSRCLTSEMKAEERDVEVIGILVAAVATDYAGRDSNLFVPDARQMAKSALHMVGSGQSQVFGYWGHALQAASFNLMPKLLADKVIGDLGKEEKRRDEERSKKL